MSLCTKLSKWCCSDRIRLVDCTEPSFPQKVVFAFLLVTQPLGFFFFFDLERVRGLRESALSPLRKKKNSPLSQNSLFLWQSKKKKKRRGEKQIKRRRKSLLFPLYSPFTLRSLVDLLSTFVSTLLITGLVGLFFASFMTLLLKSRQFTPTEKKKKKKKKKTKKKLKKKKKNGSLGYK